MTQPDRHLVEAVATLQRIEASVRRVVGDTLDVGPLATGPGGLASARARGRLERVTARRDDPPSGTIGWTVDLGVSLDLQVQVTGGTHRFSVELVVPLRLEAESATAGRVHLAASPPDPRAVTATVRPHGLQARLLDKVADVRGIVCQETATDVARRIAAPEAQAALVLTADGA